MDKVFLITGASGGIGAAVARQAVQVGYRVVLVARSQSSIQTLADELGGSTHALALQGDSTHWQNWERIIGLTLKHFGQLDMTLANAGVVKGAWSFYQGDATPDEWREMIMTNVYGTALTVRATLPELVKTKGHLLLVGSVLGRFFLPGSLYSSTKWAITGMAETIRQELRGTGVRVSLVMPGRVNTTFSEPDDDATPMINAEDVARAVLYAISQPPHVDTSEIMIRPTGQYD